MFEEVVERTKKEETEEKKKTRRTSAKKTTSKAKAKANGRVEERKSPNGSIIRTFYKD